VFCVTVSCMNCVSGVIVEWCGIVLCYCELCGMCERCDCLVVWDVCCVTVSCVGCVICVLCYCELYELCERCDC